jgi:hypothetical protein
MEFDRESAAKILALLAPRRKNEKQKKTAKDKSMRAAARRAGSAELRAAVLDRPGPVCELGNHYWPPERIQVHHLQAGSARRKLEAVHNMIRACQYDHDSWHKDGPANFVPVVKGWCARHGYPLPSVIRKAEASAQLPGRAAR